LDKLTRLIDDLLDTNRISQGHLLLQKTLIPVSELFKECCDHVINAGTHQIVFTGNQDVNVYADEQQINQVLVNFVNNAVKYAPNSNEIVIGVEQLENQLKISITDKGPGIPAEKLSYLFERYYRADHSGAKFSGLGLGLYISSEIIKKHGGAIGVESTVGRGSTFWFTLPLTGSAV
ncbi:MAG: HAMP domain-containing histidine kinase, partial [Pedobacter sp.]